MNKIEALVDAIANLHGFPHNPESDAYRLRNPLLIRSFAKPGKHEMDEQGRRVFPSLLGGYKSAIFDVELKLRGQSRAGLKPDDKLENLLRVYGISQLGGMSNVVSFLRRALKDQNISKETPLSYFLAA